MMVSSTEQIFDRLGALGESMKHMDDSVHALRQDIKRLEKRAEEREERASASRKVLYEKVDDMGDRLTVVEHRVKSTEKDVGDATEVTDRIIKRESYLKGVLAVFGLGAASGGAYTWRDTLFSWVQRLFGG